MWMSLASGVLLGLAAGITPGPLLALLLAQTLKHGAREGCKVALAPLVTDTPIILLTMFAASRLTNLPVLLGIVSCAGGMFVLYLAWDSLRQVSVDAAGPAEPPRSWFKGIMTNLLNPHPWLFWLTAGAATLAKAMEQSWLPALAFLAGFYLLLVGSKMVIAVLTARSRHVLTGRSYQLVMRVLAALLAGFAVLLFREGFRNLGWI